MGGSIFRGMAGEKCFNEAFDFYSASNDNLPKCNFDYLIFLKQN